MILVSCIWEGEFPFSLTSDMKARRKWEEREKFGPRSLGQVHQAFSGSAGGSLRIDAETRILPRSETQNSRYLCLYFYQDPICLHKENEGRTHIGFRIQESGFIFS